MNDEKILITEKSKRHLENHSWFHPCLVPANEISRLLLSFDNISSKFQKELFDLTHKDIEIELVKNECINSSFPSFRKILPRNNYIKEFRIDDEQLFIQVDPVIINEILLDRSNDSLINKVSKTVANEYIYNPLKQLLSEVSETPISENDEISESAKVYIEDCNLDNIIENPQHIVSKTPYTQSTFRIILKCKYNDIVGYIRFEFFYMAVHIFLQEEWLYNHFIRPNFYEGKNCFVTFGRTNYSQDYIDTLEAGSRLIFEKTEDEPLDVIYNGRLIATGKGIVVDNKNNSILLTDIITEDNGEYLDQADTLCCFGATYLTAQEVEKLQPDSLVELDSYVGDLFPLIYKGNVIGLGIIEASEKLFFRLVFAYRFKKPIPFILMA